MPKLKGQNDEKLNINHNNGRSHSKCHFSHSGSSTRIAYLHILENQRILHQKSANIFWPEREICRKQNASAISRMRKHVKTVNMFNVQLITKN